MARFYGEVQGHMGEVSRVGTKDSGIKAWAQGWSIGGKVECYVGNDGQDYVQVSLTGGSNRKGSEGGFFGTWRRGTDGKFERCDTPTVKEPR